MEVISNIKEMKEKISKFKINNNSIGFIPTMGYLHEGHFSLIKEAKNHNDKVVVSIFVNPIQFGANEDLSKYPRNLDKDIEACRSLDVDILFTPSEKEMYPNGYSSFVEVNSLTNTLCGKSRPSHFKGVTTVVLKLLNITECTNAYFGQKDFQQYKVIDKMVNDLNLNTKIISCPIFRENDGLAKSSRNVYLNLEERKAALCLNRSLKLALKNINSGIKDSAKIINLIKNEIEKESLAKIDYVEIVSQETLESVPTINENILIPIAVFIGNTRLIDNVTYNIQ